MGRSSARFSENHRATWPTEPTSVPLGLASFAYDMKTVRQFADRDHAKIVSLNAYGRGGHWAAHDAPDLLATTSAGSSRRSAEVAES